MNYFKLILFVIFDNSSFRLSKHIKLKIVEKFNKQTPIKTSSGHHKITNYRAKFYFVCNMATSNTSATSM